MLFAYRIDKSHMDTLPLSQTHTNPAPATVCAIKVDGVS